MGLRQVPVAPKEVVGIPAVLVLVLAVLPMVVM
jgi:hypothetical protein